MTISDKTIQLLKKAGWYEGRSIDITDMVDFLNAKGFQVFQAAKDFLKEFGKMTIRVPLVETYARSEDTHVLDPTVALGNYFTHKNFEDDEKEYGERLVPVGAIYEHNLFLMISETGKFYCETRKLGNNAWEVWEDFCSRE